MTGRCMSEVRDDGAVAPIPMRTAWWGRLTA